MLASRNRFNGRNSIMRLYKCGQALRGRNIMLRFAPTAGEPRVAVVVSKKVDKRAVVRNRIRRRLFAAMRDLGFLDRKQDVIISVFDSSFANISYGELKSEIEKLLSKPTSAKEKQSKEQ